MSFMHPVSTDQIIDLYQEKAEKCFKELDNGLYACASMQRIMIRKNIDQSVMSHNSSFSSRPALKTVTSCFSTDTISLVLWAVELIREDEDIREHEEDMGVLSSTEIDNQLLMNVLELYETT